MTVRPRIVFLTQTHNLWGGIESWLDTLASWLQAHDWDVHVGLAKGARFNDADAYLRAHPHFTQPTIMNASVGTEEARIQSIADACVNCSPDVVVPVALGAVFPSVRRLKTTGHTLRLIVPVHSMEQGYLKNVVDNFDVIDHVVGVSRLQEQFFRRALPGESIRIHYIRNGVRAPVMDRTKGNGALRVGFVGRLENHCKRVLDLIPVCERLSTTGIPIEIHIFGEGPDENTLRAELSRYATDACAVKFHRYVSNNELYQNAFPNLDVLLLFSISEGSPLTLYEAMHNGVVPVVSHFLGYATEGVIQHEENALTFPIGDVETAAAHIARLATSQGMLENLSCEAKIAVELYTTEEMCRGWEEVLTSSLRLAPCVPQFGIGTNSPAGRLEKYGLPSRAANLVRYVLRRRFPHGSGFEEWPGSQPISESAIEEVQECLLAIERDAVNRDHMLTRSGMRRRASVEA